MLQKSNASPIFGLTERHCFAQSDSSLYHGKELLFTFSEGKHSFTTFLNMRTEQQIYLQMEENVLEVAWELH